MIGEIYSAAIRDEVWMDGALLESRISYGSAVQRGNEIVAHDRLDDRTLATECDDEMARVRAVVREIEGARVRVVVRATSDEPLQATVAITIAHMSIVTSPQHAIADATMLRGMLSRAVVRAPRPASSDFVWRNGSAAVLLHEAAGHAAEHGHAPLEWPEWLRAHDGESNLLAGDPPRASRRETFRDLPMPRMREVVVEQQSAPFQSPRDAIDILLLAGGSYEPLTEMVTIDVAVAERGGMRMSPFTLHATRGAVAAAIVGAQGDPIRYPGVICSREGQELFVRSQAPVIVTTGLA